MRRATLQTLLLFACIGLVGCGGGTSQWNYDWVSANGNVSIDASGENDKRDHPHDPFAEYSLTAYKVGDPQFEAPW